MFFRTADLSIEVFAAALHPAHCAGGPHELELLLSLAGVKQRSNIQNDESITQTELRFVNWLGSITGGMTC
jgi:hypothetical protein